MSNDQGGKHKHNDKGMKKTQGHDDKLKQKNKGMPMKHDHKD